MSARDVNKALYAALNADAALLSLGVTGVFDVQAPESKSLPYVVFSKSDGTHEYVLSRRAWQAHNYVIKAIAKENKDLAERIDNRILAVLNLTRPALDNGFVMNLRRDTDISYAEQSGGSTFYHVGGLYEVMVGDA
jgi:hypothetical protein